MSKIYNLKDPIDRKIFKHHGGDIDRTIKEKQNYKEKFNRECDIISAVRLAELEEELKLFSINESIPTQSEIDECVEYQLSQSVTAKSSVITGEKNYKPEVQEFAKLAVKIVSVLIENNIKPINELIIDRVSRKMNISKISNGTLIQYCSYARKVDKD